MRGTTRPSTRALHPHVSDTQGTTGHPHLPCVVQHAGPNVTLQVCGQLVGLQFPAPADPATASCLSTARSVRASVRTGRSDACVAAARRRAASAAATCPGGPLLVAAAILRECTSASARAGRVEPRARHPVARICAFTGTGARQSNAKTGSADQARVARRVVAAGAALFALVARPMDAGVVRTAAGGLTSVGADAATARDRRDDPQRRSIPGTDPNSPASTPSRLRL